MTAPPPVLELRGICKRFAGVQALDHVSLELHAGEVHMLLGENGAGKSTLMKVLGGAHTADAGSLFHRGQANRKALVIGINGTKEAIDAIKAGRMLATGDYNGFLQGCVATMTAIRKVRNQPVLKEVVFKPAVIDRTNYQAWDNARGIADVSDVGERGGWPGNAVKAAQTWSAGAAWTALPIRADVRHGKAHARPVQRQEVPSWCPCVDAAFGDVDHDERSIWFARRGRTTLSETAMPMPRAMP